MNAATVRYDEMLYREATPAELAEGLRELLANKSGVCLVYRPARGMMDDVDDSEELYP